ncbi:MAG: hypothetical protein LBE08_13050, partial [Bifidobacteriaceae bacterium]|nr:hypothetical protein [Bifidobacteriaceae bacterium]
MEATARHLHHLDSHPAPVWVLGEEAAQENVGVNGHDAVRRARLVREVAQVAGHNAGGSRRDRGG